eukprot:355273-Chlamydomonas_euryale.AAC.2
MTPPAPFRPAAPQQQLNIYAERSGLLWKPPDALQLLRTAACLASELASGATAAAAAKATLRACGGDGDSGVAVAAADVEAAALAAHGLRAEDWACVRRDAFPEVWTCECGQGVWTGRAHIWLHACVRVRVCLHPQICDAQPSRTPPCGSTPKQCSLPAVKHANTNSTDSAATSQSLQRAPSTRPRPASTALPAPGCTLEGLHNISHSGHCECLPDPGHNEFRHLRLHDFVDASRLPMHDAPPPPHASSRAHRRAKTSSATCDCTIFRTLWLNCRVTSSTPRWPMAAPREQLMLQQQVRGVRLGGGGGRGWAGGDVRHARAADAAATAVGGYGGLVEVGAA